MTPEMKCAMKRPVMPTATPINGLFRNNPARPTLQMQRDNQEGVPAITPNFGPRLKANKRIGTIDANVIDPPWGRVKIVMRLRAPDNAIALAISARILTGTAGRSVIRFDDTGCSDASNVSNTPLVCSLLRSLRNG